MPACGLVGVRAQLGVRGGSASSRIAMRVNGGPATERAIAPGTCVTFGPFSPRAGVNTVEFSASNPVAKSTSRVRLRRLESWPTPGRTTVTSRFGWRIHPITGVLRLHAGVDIGAGYGTSIVAPSSGIVTMAGWNGGYGKCIVIDHGDGITTLFGHQSAILVSRGQRVAAGQRIGSAGSTGLSTGPHLHFELRLLGTPVDPLRYF
jgi:murein DD-endopeptidase MepM/ murein hydrolase activator NlpD